jgi:putative component of toxin-antitoxin plasmid stabilization module
MPRSQSLGDGLFELRFDLAQKAQRISFFFPGGKRVVMLTTFRKQRQNERAEVTRARRAMARCIAEGHTVEGETE